MTERTVANDRYVLSEPPIGVGGMGTVWKAYDTVLRRDVAVKELRIPAGLSPEEHEAMRARAMREAQAAAGLDHPGIVTIHDVVDDGGLPWIVMRLLAGRSLDLAVREDGPLSPRDAAELGVRLLDALVAAHAGGVLHRDVKPQNVMHDDGGRWLLTDFGIASVAGSTRTLTGTGLVTGTLGYVAPERLSGVTPGAAADLWSLGATLYFAVEGRHAYRHDDLPAMIAAILTRDPDPADRAGALAPVIAGLMERDPDLRMDPGAARSHLLAVAEGRPTDEAAAEQTGGPSRPTEKLDKPTKALPTTMAQPTKVLPERRAGSDGATSPRDPGPAATLSPARRRSALRWLGWLLATLNAAVGTFLALAVDGLQNQMPGWIAGVLAAVLAVGGLLGTWLASRLTRWLGLAPAQTRTALLLGGSLVAAAVLGGLGAPYLAIVPAVLALVVFPTWNRLARLVRQRIVPEEQRGRATVDHWMTVLAALLLGGAAGSSVPEEGFALLIGVVLAAAGLTTLPAIWDLDV